MRSAWNACWARSLAGGASGEGWSAAAGRHRQDDKVHLLVVMTSDRGLCGGFNGSIMRGVRTMVRDLEAEGKTVKLFGVGRKGNAIMQREFPDKLVDALEEIAAGPELRQRQHDRVDNLIAEMFDNGDFDVLHRRLQQVHLGADPGEVTPQQLIPFAVPEGRARRRRNERRQRFYDFEPDEEEILADLLPRNLGVQVYRAMLENLRQRARRADDRDGQRDPERGRHDR